MNSTLKYNIYNIYLKIFMFGLFCFSLNNLTGQTISIYGGLSFPKMAFANNGINTKEFSGYAKNGYSTSLGFGFSLNKKWSKRFLLSYYSNEVSELLAEKRLPGFQVKNVVSNNWQTGIATFGWVRNFNFNHVYIKPILDVGVFMSNNPGITSEVYDQFNNPYGVISVKVFDPDKKPFGLYLSVATKVLTPISKQFNVFIEPSFGYGLMFPFIFGDAISWLNLPIGLTYYFNKPFLSSELK